jgi:hypothetical protein
VICISYSQLSILVIVHWFVFNRWGDHHVMSVVFSNSTHVVIRTRTCHEHLSYHSYIHEISMTNDKTAVFRGKPWLHARYSIVHWIQWPSHVHRSFAMINKRTSIGSIYSSLSLTCFKRVERVICFHDTTSLLSKF